MKAWYIKIIPCLIPTLTGIKNEIGENNIWIAVDETTDTNGCYVVNLLVGILKWNILTCKISPGGWHANL